MEIAAAIPTFRAVVGLNSLARRTDWLVNGFAEMFPFLVEHIRALGAPIPAAPRRVQFLSSMLHELEQEEAGDPFRSISDRDKHRKEKQRERHQED